MPKKSQQNKPNGFVIFANEIRDELLREGHIIRSMPDLITVASPKWQSLPSEEREYYKDRAKWEWDNRNGNVSQCRKKPDRPDRKDCTGAFIEGRVDLVQVNEERRKRERTEVFLSWPSGRAVLERNFYFISFICLLEEPHYQPIEVAAVEFNLLGGIIRDWHKYIDPGPIEIGYQYLAQQLSESTHKIPVEGIAQPGDTYTSIYDELLHFLSRGTTHIPPIHVKMSECEKVEGCIKWLARMAGRPHQLKRIYELEGLVLDLDFHLKGQPQDFFQSKATATTLLSSTMFDWDSGSKCQYHEENETRHCARGYIYKFCYLIADYFCQMFQITATERHLPAKQEKSYTLIKSESTRAKEKKLESRAFSKDMFCNDDMARRVTEQLKLEEERRTFDEDEVERREIESEQARLEEKKRWLSLRGADASQDSAGVQINGTECNNNVQMPVFGRGRGRGAHTTLQTLRRPGDKSTDAPNTNVPDNEKHVPFGRGTKMYTGK